MARVYCPNRECKKALTLPDAQVGRKVRCKACGTSFIASTDNGPSSASPDAGGIITVVARRVSIQAMPRGMPMAPPVLRTESFAPVSAASVAPPSRPSVARAKTPWLFVSVAAVVLPLVCFGSYLAIKFLSSEGVFPDEEAQSGVYGGIEIGSSGIKGAVYEFLPDKTLDYDFKTKVKKSIDAKIIAGMEKTKQFDRRALADAVGHVQTFCDSMVKDWNVPRERIFIIGSSGLFMPIREREDLSDEDKDTSIKANREALSSAIKKVTQIEMEFLDVRGEVGALIKSLVAPERYKSSVLVDIGTGSTRGGYYDEAGPLVAFEMNGGQSFGTMIEKASKNTKEYPEAARGVAKKLREGLEQELVRKAPLASRERVYLNGGIVWMLATFLHQEADASLVRLDAGDFARFHDLVCADPDVFPPLPPPPANIRPEARKRVEDDVAKMRNIFKQPQRRIAGAELLLTLAKTLDLDKEKKELYFTRDGGDVGTLQTYLAEKYLAARR